MKKAYSNVKQDKVQVVTIDGYTYVSIYLNETEEKVKDLGYEGLTDREKNVERVQYVYDFNELKGKATDVNIEAIKKEPEKYLDVSEIKGTEADITPPTIEQRVSSLEDGLLSVIMGGAE